MNDDYFSFMSERGHNKHVQAAQRRDAPSKDPSADGSIDADGDAPNSSMEVSEKSVGATTIQRIFKRFKPAEAPAPARGPVKDPP